MRDVIPPGHFFRKIRYCNQISLGDECEEDRSDEYPRPPEVKKLPWLRSAPMPHPAAHFLFGRQHDAPMQGVEIEGDKITLHMHDHDLWCLSTHMGRRLGRAEEPDLPVDMVFSGVTAWTAYLSDACRWPMHRLRHNISANLDAAEMLYDRVISWDEDRIVAFFQMTLRHRERYFHTKRHKEYYKYLVLGVDAKKVAVIEQQRGAWLDSYGPEYLYVFDRFEAIRDEPQNWSSTITCNLFLDELGIKFL